MVLISSGICRFPVGISVFGNAAAAVIMMLIMLLMGILMVLCFIDGGTSMGKTGRMRSSRMVAAVICASCVAARITDGGPAGDSGK